MGTGDIKEEHLETKAVRAVIQGNRANEFVTKC